jgi:hypothetical protein
VTVDGTINEIDSQGGMNEKEDYSINDEGYIVDKKGEVVGGEGYTINEERQVVDSEGTVIDVEEEEISVTRKGYIINRFGNVIGGTQGYTVSGEGQIIPIDYDTEGGDGSGMAEAENGELDGDYWDPTQMQ